MTELAEAVLNGSRRALARLLTAVENESEGAQRALATLFPHTGNAWIIGVTGAPGTGKSSLVNMIAKTYRQQDKTVAIVAVDPTSPFSGGAILGDRIRMRDLSGDKGVFIRSMATRGSLGGLAQATRDIIRVLDAAKYDIILVETVGAGQSEVDIVRTAQTTLVVEAPGLGDDVQAIKAGILEIADVLVVNKSDRPGADNTVRGLRAMLELGHPTSRKQFVSHHGKMLEAEPTTHVESDTLSDIWLPPVIRTTATESPVGIDELLEAIKQHRAYLIANDKLGEMEYQRIQLELYERIQHSLINKLFEVVPENVLQDVVAQIQSRTLNPQQAVEQLVGQFVG